MSINDGWGILFLVVGCPLIGGMPITAWIVRGLTGKKLKDLGTGNIGVSAAFYHGGTGVGVCSVLAEAAKGIGCVLGVRALLPSNPTLELAALVALVAGRFWIGRGAGTTNAVWGVTAYDWRVALTMFLVSGGMKAVVPERRKIRWLALMVLPIVIAVMRQDLSETLMAITLSGLLAWVYIQRPEDLALPAGQAHTESRGAFELLGGTSGLVSLNQPLLAEKVGQKAATLAQLIRWGFSVPEGWVLPPGDDAEPLIKAINPSVDQPWVVRSSAMGEDSDQASAAGQYQTVLDVTSQEGLRRAIAQCQDCYDDPAAAQYRQSRGVAEGGMAVIVQRQIQGQYSGVAFSRDPSSGDGEAVAIEGLPGLATNVVSGHVTPERYLVTIPALGTSGNGVIKGVITGESGQIPEEIPEEIIERVAVLVRDLEARYHGVPQDMEWTYDGTTLWVLQTRTITTLLPIWTRRIAAEVIPGVIRPLTWSINQPLTCGVWADLFKSILGGRSDPFRVQELATLHYGHAYFNATLLGQLFRRMGLPAESLEFLTRGASMGRPSPGAMLKTLPGLTKLLLQEWTLPSAFRQQYRTAFAPLLESIAAQPSLSSSTAILERIDALLSALRSATFFSILAPISAAVRQKLWRVEDTALDTSVLPEMAALRSLHNLASRHSPSLDAESVCSEMEAFLAQYGYLSDVATDISIPTWQEDPQPVWLLLQNLGSTPAPASAKRQGWTTRIVQKRLTLKGQVAEVYSRLLAELRYALLALEQDALSQGLLQQTGDIFFLTLSELREWVTQPSPRLKASLFQQVVARSHEFELAQELTGVPTIVYGTPPPLSVLQNPTPAAGSLHGIDASPGIVEGTVLVLRSLRQIPATLSRQTILVVPYTDAGWSPVLAQVGGIVAEVGGRLSHGAIIAREYGIPAVMDIAQATQRFKNGQRVRVDGYRGIVEIL